MSTCKLTSLLVSLHAVL